MISASLRLEVPEIVMRCSLPVSISRARTITIPLASLSKVTSIFGTPAHARYGALGTMAVGEGGGELATVSYTHLDVYKRQTYSCGLPTYW